MIVKNDYIIIKQGRQQIKFHNMILNEYIDKLIENQTRTTNRNSLLMKNIYIKFDDVLQIDENSTITSSDFDITFENEDYSVDYDNTKINVVYNYNTLYGRFKFTDIQNQDAYSDLSDYIGKQITAIGFGKGYEDEEINLFAVVDTSNYALYFNGTEEAMNITRKDIFSTDGSFYCPSGIVKGLVHLLDDYTYINALNSQTYFGVLESVGLGVSRYAMNQEHKLLPYEDNISIEDNIIQINKEMVIEHDSNGLFPDNNIYPNNSLYPARVITEAVYPSEDIYPGEELYPISVPYQYAQLKYKVYLAKNIRGQTTLEDTGKFYLISNVIGNKKLIKENLEYEKL